MSTDVFNIAVWSNKNSDRVNFFKRVLFTVLSIGVVLLQVQISTHIMSGFAAEIKEKLGS